jgi:hypothetical protein
MTISEKITGVGGLMGTPHVSPNATGPFDIDTGYKASEASC